MRGRAVAILFALLAAACTPGPDADPQQLRSLAQEARGLVATPVIDGRRDIPSRDWPPSIILLKPSRVYAAPEGLYLQASAYFGNEAGYFIPRDGAAFTPGGDRTYKVLGHGVYWYEVKDTE